MLNIFERCFGRSARGMAQDNGLDEARTVELTNEAESCISMIRDARGDTVAAATDADLVEVAMRVLRWTLLRADKVFVIDGDNLSGFEISFPRPKLPPAKPGPAKVYH